MTALLDDMQMFGNEIGIRVEQKDDVTAWTASTILSNNIYNNRGSGLYIRTSRQKPTATSDRRVISSNDIHHNAVIGNGCLAGVDVQAASQVVFDGPVIGTDTSAGALGPDPAYPDDYRCYVGADQTAPPLGETECARMNDPEDVIAGGANNHCIWIGTQCRLAWDVAGTVGTGECGASDNRIFAYVNHPAQPELTQKGLVATNGAFVLARRNTWGVGGADNGTHAVSGTNSEIDSEDACSTIATCSY